MHALNWKEHVICWGTNCFFSFEPVTFWEWTSAYLYESKEATIKYIIIKSFTPLKNNIPFTTKYSNFCIQSSSCRCPEVHFLRKINHSHSKTAICSSHYNRALQRSCQGSFSENAPNIPTVGLFNPSSPSSTSRTKHFPTNPVPGISYRVIILNVTMGRWESVLETNRNLPPLIAKEKGLVCKVLFVYVHFFDVLQEANCV